MSTELNSGTVGGFGHMGPNDPYNDDHSDSGSSGGSFNGGGNGGHDNSSGSSYTASFGLITGRHPITVPGTKNINSWIGPYISIHFLSLNPLLVRRRRYSRGERYPSALCGCHSL